MRIEIIVNNDDPLVYPLNKPKLIIGSHEGCDIVLSAENISRKHVAVVTEDDNYYVVDQGSTNGTFLNEERLVPGRRVEFTSFFPIRLGTEVLLTLLSDEEKTVEEKISIPVPTPQPKKIHLSSSPTEQTRQISLKDLHRSTTESLVKKRQEIKRGSEKKNVKKKSKEQSRFLWVKLFAAVIIGGATYYSLYVQEKIVPVKIEKIGRLDDKPEVVVPVKIIQVVDDADLTTKESLMNMLGDIKCATDVEKYLCDTIPGANSGMYGSVQVGTMANILIDGTKYFEEAKLDIRVIPGDAYNLEVAQLSAFLFLKNALPANFNYKQLEGSKITFALFKDKNETEKEIIVVIATTPEKLEAFTKLPLDEIIKNVRLVGASALNGAVKDMVRFY